MPKATSGEGDEPDGPGEANRPYASDETWDRVDEASWGSFPASDPPSFWAGADREPKRSEPVLAPGKARARDRAHALTSPAGLTLRLGRLFGVELVADVSVGVIFLIVALQLGWGAFPRWHPEWGAGLVWLVALIAAVLLFVSILLHELSHALVARAYAIPVRRITLFMFGGVAELEREPSSPKAEFLMAAVGPVVSAMIGLLSLFLGGLVQGASLAASPDPEAALRSMNPLATILYWLGPVNLSLALFNLVPGFPLDGGRVLRSALWAITGDLRRATAWASTLGQAFAWLLIAAGVGAILGLDVPGFGRGGAQGLWLVLIGWFLHNAARSSYRQLVVREALEHVPVREVMRSRVDAVPPDVVLDDLVRDYFMNSDQLDFPVVEDGVLLGVISAGDVRHVARGDWARVRVREAMTPLRRVHALHPDDDAFAALRELAEHDSLPVTDHERLVGIAHRGDVLRWLSLHPPRP